MNNGYTVYMINVNSVTVVSHSGILSRILLILGGRGGFVVLSVRCASEKMGEYSEELH